jgi:dTDP-4-amino-4,6-dideoxygalactose transaminase
VTRYAHDVVGYNSRMDALQGAVLGVKLRHLDGWNGLRREHARLYARCFTEIPAVVTPVIGEHRTHVFHLYVVTLEAGNRDALQAYLLERGIQTGIHYPAPVHLTPAFRSLGYQAGAFPVAEDASRRILSLPMFPEMTPDAVASVAEEIGRFLRRPVEQAG